MTPCTCGHPFARFDPAIDDYVCEKCGECAGTGYIV
jgi:hypothetical protein